CRRRGVADGRPHVAGSSPAGLRRPGRTGPRDRTMCRPPSIGPRIRTLFRLFFRNRLVVRRPGRGETGRWEKLRQELDEGLFAEATAFLRIEPVEKRIGRPEQLL